MTLTSWSLPIDSLTLPSLSFPRGNLESLTLQSLSLIAENRLQRISFKEVIFGDGSLKETAESLAHNKAERRAGTNSFSNMSFQERMLAQEAETNSFFTQSFSDRILSLRMCLRIFLLSSFQLICAALLLGTYSVSLSFPSQSLQQDELEVAHSQSPTRASQLQHHSLKQQELYRSSSTEIERSALQKHL